MPPPLRAAVDAAGRALRPLTFDQRMAAGLFALLALLPLVSPLLGGGYVLHITCRALILGLAATSLELLIGVAGMVSFGHAAFLGIGAYAAGIAASHGLGTLGVALPAALAACAVFALFTGAIAVRTRGVYFIMITLAFGQMAFFVATSLAPYGGDDGLSWPGRTLVLGTPALESEAAFFYVALGGAVAAYVLTSRLAASRFGRVLRGLTGSETRLQAIGFAPYPFRLTAYVIAGMMCGLAGFLLGNHAEFVSPAYMHWQRSGELIVIVLLGGTGTVYGPLLGAIAYVLLEETLSGLTEHWKAILGPILVLVVLFARGGIAGAIEQAIAAWRRSRPGPRRLIEALAALVVQRAAEVPTLIGNRLERVGGRAGTRVGHLAAVGRRWLGQLTLRFEHGLAEVRVRCNPWAGSLAHRVRVMAAMVEKQSAHLFLQCRGTAHALERKLGGLLALLAQTVAELQARWQPWKLALGRRLVSLVLLAERSIADAAHRWRRR
jgi:branched-chain amino acid transport system permease protein